LASVGSMLPAHGPTLEDFEELCDRVHTSLERMMMLEAAANHLNEVKVDKGVLKSLKSVIEQLWRAVQELQGAPDGTTPPCTYCWSLHQFRGIYALW
jgi:hypothetical protein